MRGPNLSGVHASLLPDFYFERPYCPSIFFSLFFVLQAHSYFHMSPNARWFDFFYFITDTAGNLPQLFRTKSPKWVHLDWLHGCWSRPEGSCLGYLQDAGKWVGGLGPPEGLVLDEWRACDSPFSGALKWVFSFLLKSSLFTLWGCKVGHNWSDLACMP